MGAKPFDASKARMLESVRSTFLHSLGQKRFIGKFETLSAQWTSPDVAIVPEVDLTKEIGKHGAWLRPSEFNGLRKSPSSHFYHSRCANNFNNLMEIQWRGVLKSKHIVSTET